MPQAHLPTRTLPDHWQASIQPILNQDETVLAWLETDLDAQLYFSAGLILLTSQRLLAKAESDSDWQQWRLSPELALQLADHAGVGSLELRDGSARLACWRYTMNHNTGALRLLGALDRLRENRSDGQVMAEDETLCPNCKNTLPPDEETCPVCSREIHTPPSTWTLFRLWRFARPYRGQLLAGFLLTLASTAATLVPPYLTMPMMDKVLIPYQNGTPIDTGLVALLLSGLLGSALLAWGLGWARTYILALVSERMGADLRTTTYDHLSSSRWSISAANAPAT